MWYATTTAGSGQLSSSVHAPLLGLRRLLRECRAAPGWSDFGTRPRYCVHERAAPPSSRSRRRAPRRVVRHVVGLEEVAHVVDRRRLEILHAADRRVLVGMHGERLVADDLLQPAVRLVLDAHPPLFLDDLALGLERLLVDPQRRHAIGFEPQHERQVLRRHRFPEHRRVLGRVGVALAADARDVRRMPFGLDVLRSLEHHVLEQMREAGAPGPLVLRAHVIPDLQVHDRRGMIFEEDHVQAVGQRGHRVVEPRRPHGRVGRRAARRARQRERPRRSNAAGDA